MKFIFIQARYNSKRLKGKVLKKINQIPILLFLINRLKKIKRSKIIVLTSNNKSDDKIVEFCKKNNLEFFRGSHLNVYKRYCQALKYYNPSFFTRICGDSPFQDQLIIEKMINLYKKKKIEIVTNVFPRSFPIGMSVEIIKTSFFLENEKFIKDKKFKEHITSYFYKNKKNKIFNFKSRKDYSKINLSINTLNEYKKIKSFLENNSKKKNDFNFLIKHFKN